MSGPLTVADILRRLSDEDVDGRLNSAIRVEVDVWWGSEKTSFDVPAFAVRYEDGALKLYGRLAVPVQAIKPPSGT